MEDYRSNPHQSPWLWCLRCKRLVKADEKAFVMRTTYYLHPNGVFPFGFCSSHAPKSRT
jgi:hypothetical protein